MCCPSHLQHPELVHQAQPLALPQATLEAGPCAWSPCRGRPDSRAEAPQPPYDGPEAASDLEGVSDFGRSWAPKKEGRQTFRQSLGQGGWAQNSPQGSPPPPWPRGPDHFKQTTPQTSRWPRAPEEREGEGQAASTGAVRAARAVPGSPERGRGAGVAHPDTGVPTQPHRQEPLPGREREAGWPAQPGGIAV